MIDLEPATVRLTRLLADVRDDQLDAETPCAGTSVGDLIDHIRMFAAVFAAAARKRQDGPVAGGPPPPPSASNLQAGWREGVADDLRGLAGAWRAPSAWEGMTKAGGNDLPAEVAGLVVLDELVVHGWDLAVSTGQRYQVPDDDVETAMSFVRSFEAPRDGTLFGPVVDVPPDAPPLDRLLGLTGRDPRWRPSGPRLRT